MWNVEKNSSITPSSYDPQNRKRRQESNEQVLENGAIYATTRKAFKKSQCRISGKIGFYPMPMELSYNIDNEDDLHNAERILQNQKIYDLFSVKGKNIIITGASGLLGSFFSRTLLEGGDNLALIDHNTSVSQALKEEFGNEGQIIQIYKCDLSKPNQISATIKNHAVRRKHNRSFPVRGWRDHLGGLRVLGRRRYHTDADVRKNQRCQ